jgi:hypothetical protein
MSRFFPLMIVLLAVSCALSCGSGGRQLRSIAISRTTIGNHIQFVATGTFSAAPTTVTPLSTFWTVDLPPQQYALTTQPFVIQCTGPGPVPGPITAWAPADPNAPSSGSLSGTKMITASMGASCP